MDFGYKTIILGGNDFGVLTLSSSNGLKGKLKCKQKGDDVFLAVLSSLSLAVVPSSEFDSFSLPVLDVEDLNAYIIKGDKIMSHGKTAAVRPPDNVVFEKIRSYRYEHSTREKIDENLSQTLSRSAQNAEDSGKKRISDYFFDIRRYDDDAIAEVNYFAENSPDLTAIDFSEVASDTTFTNSVTSENVVFVYPDTGLVLPSSFERSFLCRERELKACEKGEQRTRRTRLRTERKRQNSKNIGIKKASNARAESVDDENKKNVSVIGENVVSEVSDADFFREVEAQIKELMKTYPHEERLEQLIPSSEFALIPLAEGGKYVIGAISSLYIVYGVPGERTAPPAELKNAVFLPVGDDEEGYWMLFQDAATGESINVDFDDKRD